MGAHYLRGFKNFFLLASALHLAMWPSTVANAYPTVVAHGTTVFDPSAVYSGYTLFAPMGGQSGGGGASEIKLIGMNGAVVHTWEVDYQPGLYGFLTKDAKLIYGGKKANLDIELPQGGGGIIQEIDWNGQVVWEYEDPYLHHDFDRLPNGNILAILWEALPANLASEVRGGAPGTELKSGKIYSDVFIEIDRDTKEIVWEWRPQDSFLISEYPLVDPDNRFEWTHANAVEYIPEGNSFNGREMVLVSFRQIDLVAMIDKKTKEVVWTWGPGVIKKQHNPTLLDNGNVLVFDNGIHRRAEADGESIEALPSSRVVEVDPETNQVQWTYTGDAIMGQDFLSTVISGAQRLPNGNTLITEGTTGRIFEVATTSTTEGGIKNEIVWEYVSPFYAPNPPRFNWIFRAYRYGQDDIAWPEPLPASTNWQFNTQNVYPWYDAEHQPGARNQQPYASRVLLLASVTLNAFLFLKVRSLRAGSKKSKQHAT